MKQFHRLPSWLKIIVPVTFVSTCMGINAIAFTHIRDSLSARRPLSAVNPANSSIIVQSTASTTPSANQLVVTPDDDLLNAEQSEPKYGHFPYAEGDTAEMALVASYAEGDFNRAETLHPTAAKALLEMVSAARVDGIWLVPASGFRTIAQQRTLFNAQIAKRGTPEAAARVSAPPGYSEHHTGYAIDLTDGTLPQNEDISETFADTAAYQWLLTNAQTYGFELSFPPDNSQGISFEPWHWRYVGTPEARAALGQSTESLDTRNATSSVVE